MAVFSSNSHPGARHATPRVRPHPFDGGMDGRNSRGGPGLRRTGRADGHGPAVGADHVHDADRGHVPAPGLHIAVVWDVAGELLGRVPAALQLLRLALPAARPAVCGLRLERLPVLWPALRRSEHALDLAGPE